MLKRSFWKNKKVFLTGHTGFKGSWMLVMINALGAKCKGYALNPPTKPSMYNLISGGNLCESIIADITDFTRLKHEINIFQPDIVIHMAAQPLVIQGYESPRETFEINVMGTVNLLEAVKETKNIKAVVNVTTDKVYQNAPSNNGYTEEDILGGYDPYSNSKACSELVTSCYRDSFFNINNLSKHGCGIASVRAGNVLGGGDFAKDRLLPDIIRAVESKSKLYIRNGNAIRPWQHVLEPLSCYLVTAQNIIENGGDYCTSFNIAPDIENCLPVIDVVKLFCKKLGGNIDYEIEQRQYHETKVLLLNNSKAKKMLKYNPVYNIDATLEKVASWSKQYITGGDMAAVTLTQVNSYLQKICK